MARPRPSRLPAPYLRRIRLRPEAVPPERPYPFSLPFLAGDFSLEFDQPVTVFVGENGTGKSTLLEAIAALAGFDDAGGAVGVRLVDHLGAVERHGGALGSALVGEWLPKVAGVDFFRAESFYAVARGLDRAALEVGAVPPDFLSRSHGEGFLSFFAARCARAGLLLLDEPESALSPDSQLELLQILDTLAQGRRTQIVMATHSPLLMALPGARLLELGPRGPRPVALEDVPGFRRWRAFYADPHAFVRRGLAGVAPG